MSPRVRERVKEGLARLEGFPAVKLDLVKVAGESASIGFASASSGALFKVYESEKTIVVVKIDHRKRVYG